MADGFDLEKLDRKIAFGSGALSAALDIILVPELSFADANKWGKEKLQSFVINVAKERGYTGADISEACSHLREEEVDAGTLFSGAVSFGVEDVDLIANQLGIDGLLFSVLTYMTGKAIGFTEGGEFVFSNIDGFKKKPLEESIYWGTLHWVFNLVCAALDNGLDKVTGFMNSEIPGKIRDLMQMMVMIPGLKEKVEKLLDKEKVLHDKDAMYKAISDRIYDAIEKADSGKANIGIILGVVHEAVDKKQYIPVAVNEMIVAAYYTASRLLWQLSIEASEEEFKLDFMACLPYDSEELRKMRKQAYSTFVSINMIKAGVKAATGAKNGIKDFCLHFFQNINYFGIAGLVGNLGSLNDTYMGKLYVRFQTVVKGQKQLFNKVLDSAKQAAQMAGEAAETAKTIKDIASPTNYVEAVREVYEALENAYAELEMAREERKRIVAECEEHIRELEEYEEEMQQVISDYFVTKYLVFEQAFDLIDRAISEDDVDAFISGQNMIQMELSGKVLFKDMDGFNDMMDSDDPIVF